MHYTHGCGFIYSREPRELHVHELCAACMSRLIFVLYSKRKSYAILLAICRAKFDQGQAN